LCVTFSDLPSPAELSGVNGNAAMLDMCRNLGFQAKADPEDPSLVVVTLSL
jgi:hypothetical protein